MTDLREAKLKAHQNHIILVMRAGLDDKIWWDFDEIAKALAISGAYVSQLTKDMREKGVLIVKEKRARPMFLKLNPTLAVQIPVQKGDVAYFGPVTTIDVDKAKTLAGLDGTSTPIWFHRAVEAYQEKRAKILNEGW